MPHLVFATPLTLNHIAARFEPLQESADGINIHLMQAFLSDGALLVETHVGEPTITQHVALMIVARQKPETPHLNEFTIQLGTIGQPRPTVGIHRAVRLLADWVLGLDAANIVVKQKVNAE